MIEILLTVIPSIVWIIYRCYQLFQTPAEVLINDLNIKIPHSANICIDSISNTSAVIHWDMIVGDDESLFYVLLINNKEAATLSSTSCKLNNLQQNKLYQIQVTAINSLTNLRSQSNPVYIQTLCKSSEEYESDIINKFQLTLREELTDEELLKPEGDLSAEKIKTIDSLELLKKYLYYYQNGLNKLFCELNELQKNMSSDQRILMDEIDQYKLQLHEETDNKIKQDNDVKDLENQKDNLTFKKLKLNKQLETLNTSKTIYDSNLHDLKVKIKKLTERKMHILSNRQSDINKINYELNKLLNELQFIKNENVTIEESLKNKTFDKRQLVGFIDSLRPLLNLWNYPVVSSSLLDEKLAGTGSLSIKQLIPEIIHQFNNPTPNQVTSPTESSASQNMIDMFNKDGTLSRSGEEVLSIILELKPDWKADFDKELNEVVDLENEWKICFKNELRKYTSIYNSLDIAKLNNDANHQSQKMTEYSASIEFGGVNNALPKPSLNNSSKYKSKNYGALTASPPSYDGFGSNFLNANSASPSPIPSANTTIDDVVVNRRRSVSLNNGVVSYSNDNWHSFYGNVYTNSTNNVEEVPLAQSELRANATPLDAHMMTPTQMDHSLLHSQLDSSLAGGQMATSQSRGFPYDDQIYNSISSPIEDPSSTMNYSSDANFMNYKSPPLTLGLNSSLLWNDGLLNDSSNNLPSLNALSNNLNYNNSLLGSNTFLGNNHPLVNDPNNLGSLNNSDLSLGQSAFANPLTSTGGSRFGPFGTLNSLTPPTGQVDINTPGSNTAVVGSPNTGNGILLTNSASQVGHTDFGNKLWNENGNGSGHARNVSTNSRDGIWRNGTTNPNGPNNGGANFQPFSFYS